MGKLKYKVMIGRKIEEKDLSFREAVSLKGVLSETYKRVHIETQKNG